MSDFFNPLFWTIYISIGALGGIAWLIYLLIANSKIKTPADGEEVKSTGHAWDGIEELNNPLPFWWVAMFYITIVFGLIYLVLYPGLGTAKGILGWTSDNEHSEEVSLADKKYEPLYQKYASIAIAELAKNEKANRTGGRLFANYCTICHGSDGRGAKGFPNIADNDWLYGGSGEQIKNTIMNGRHGNMPAWKAVIGEKGVTDVTSYVLSLSGRKAPAQEVAAGQQIFATNCTGCHQADAKGMFALGAPNLTDNVWLYGATRGMVEQSIADGRTGVMPAHQELLGEAKVHILAAYVYSLREH